MASNVFDQSPLQYSLGATRPTNRTPAASAASSVQASRTIKDVFDEIAVQSSIPANLLIAMAEASGAADGDALLKAGTDGLSTLKDALAASNGDHKAALTAIFHGNQAQANAVLDRAYALADSLYSPDVGKDNLFVEDLARQLGGSIIKGVGAMAIGADEMIDGAARGIAGALPNATFKDRDGSLAGDWINGLGDKLQAGVSDEAKQLMGDASPDGSLFDPRSWSVGENPSLKGYGMLAADVLGSFLPVVAASVLSGGTAGMVVGGLQGAGAASEQAAQIVDQAALTVDSLGVSNLERESAYYREARARGMTHDEAVLATKEAASQIAALMTAPISALGGYATSSILTKPAGAIASRGLAGRIAGTAALSGLEEGLQEAAESIATRYGTSVSTGWDSLDLTEGTFGDFVLGAIGGAPVGGLAGIKRREDPQTQKQNTNLNQAAPQPNPQAGPQAAPNAAAPTSTPPQGGAQPTPTAGGSSGGVAPSPAIDPSQMAGGGAPINADPFPQAPIAPAAPQGLAGALDAAGVKPTLIAEDTEASARLYGHLSKGDLVELSTPDGLLVSSTFLGETEKGVLVDVHGDHIEIPSKEFDAAVAAAEAKNAGTLNQLVSTPAKEVADAFTGSEDVIDDNDGPDGRPAPEVADEAADAAEAAVEVEEQPAEATLPDATGPSAAQTRWEQASKEERRAFLLETGEWTAPHGGLKAYIEFQLVKDWDDLGKAVRASLDAFSGPSEAERDTKEAETFTDAPESVTKGAESITDEAPEGGADIDAMLEDAFAEAEAEDLANQDTVKKDEEAAVEAVEAGEEAQAVDTAEEAKAEEAEQTQPETASFEPEAEVSQETEAKATRPDTADDPSSVDASETAETRDKPEAEAAPATEEAVPTTEEVEEAAAETDPNPTDGQKEAENYKTGKIDWRGRTLSIENAKGSERSGKDAEGNEWKVTMPATYGRILGTTGNDGDHVDFFMGDNPASESVFVIDQSDGDGGFDEHKVMLGFDNEAQAKATYLLSFSGTYGATIFDGITEMSLATFDEWLAEGDMSQPVSAAEEEVDASETEKSEEQKAKEREAKIAKINDFGEKIGGARKDRASKMIVDLSMEINGNDENQKLSDLLPVPDYAALAENGISPEALVMIQDIRASVGRKPSNGRWGISSWMGDVITARKAITDVLQNPEVGKAKMAEYFDNLQKRIEIANKEKAEGKRSHYRNPENWTQTIYSTNAHNNEAIWFAARAHLPASILQEAATLVPDGFRFEWLEKDQRGEGQREVAVAAMARRNGWARRVTFKEVDKPTVSLDQLGDPAVIGPILAKHLEQLVVAKRLSNLDKPKRTRKPVVLQFTSFSRGAAGVQDHERFTAAFEGASGNMVPVGPRFATKQAMDAYYADEAHVEEVKREAEKIRAGLPERNKTNRPRVGAEHFTGNVTEQMFKDAFGFRGVEFGNWTSNTDRQRSMNEAYNALFDMVGALGLPTKAVSLNGKLGLAFGARGNGGWAAAHYEPSYVVINLTKTMGAGSLAHEWLHAIDNYYGGKLNGAEGANNFWGSESRSSRHQDRGAAHLWDELRQALRRKDHPWLGRSQVLDNARSAPYFSTTIEMAARSFERHVIAKLQERGMQNDYLANINKFNGVYPTVDELRMAGISRAYEALFDLWRTEFAEAGGQKVSLPDVDPAKVAKSPLEVGTTWESVDGTKTVKEIDFEANTATLETHHEATDIRGLSQWTADELEFERVKDMKAMTPAAKKAREEAKAAALAQKILIENFQKEQRETRDKIREEASVWLERYLSVNRAAAIRNALTGKYYNFGGDIGTASRAVMIYHQVANKGQRVHKSGGGNRYFVYDKSVVTKAGFDYAEWLPKAMEEEAKRAKEEAEKPENRNGIGLIDKEAVPMVAKRLGISEDAAFELIDKNRADLMAEDGSGHDIEKLADLVNEERSRLAKEAARKAAEDAEADISQLLDDAFDALEAEDAENGLADITPEDEAHLFGTKPAEKTSVDVSEGQKTVGEALSDAKASGKAALLDIGKALTAILNTPVDPNKLNSGPVFLEDVWKQVLPHLKSAWSNATDASMSIAEAIKAFVKALRDDAGLTVETQRQLKPYLKRFVSEVQNGTISVQDDAESDILDGEEASNDIEAGTRGDSQGSLEEARPEGGSRPDGEAGGYSGSQAGGADARGGATVSTDGSGPDAGNVGSDPDGDTGQAAELTSNFSIPEGFNVGALTDGQKIAANISAIRLMKAIMAEGRAATMEEKAKLALYTGWGGLKNVFAYKNEGKTDVWGRAQADLKALLTKEEYSAAFDSISNAHYTDIKIVKAMWSAMRHFGFRGGRALEPTAGVGNFIGAMPADIETVTQWHGTELDAVTGNIAKLLYPRAEILAATGFQDADFGEGVFDIAIGNPPFGSETIRDKRRPDISGLNIHNYIIAKSGKHLREGGVMAMVVTHRFLDSNDTTGRAALAKTFKLLGAVRLPNDAFLANAGTEVTTDIVFLQKLKAGEVATDNSWLEHGEIEGGIVVNGYFAKNPQQILGRSAMDGTMYGGGGNEYTVHSDGRDLETALHGAIHLNMNDTAGALDLSGNAANIAATVLEQKSDLSIGAVRLYPDGKIRRRTDANLHGPVTIEEVTPQTLWKDYAEQWAALVTLLEGAKSDLRAGREIEPSTVFDFVEIATVVAKSSKSQAADAVTAFAEDFPLTSEVWGKKQEEGLELIRKAAESRLLGKNYDRLKGMLTLRNMTLEQIRLEQSDDPTMEDHRKTLKAAYDAFVKKFGFLSSDTNQRIVDGDVGAEAGLELRYTKKSDTEKESAVTNAILTERVLTPTKEITKAANPQDAVKISLSERGRIDIAYMARLTGMKPADIIKELTAGDHPEIYLNPKTGEYDHAEDYLSGNVRQKLTDAIEAGRTANIEALQKVQPARVARADITPTLRSLWMPESIFEAFLTDLGVSSPRVSIIPSIGKAVIGHSGTRLTELGQRFSSQHATIPELVSSIIAGKPIKITEKDGQGRVRTNEEATRAVGALADRLAELFQKEWAFADEDRAKAIEDAYQDKMNTHVLRKYDGSKYLRLEGASKKINLRPTQKNAAWRLIQRPNTLLDHVVGAGKTFTVIAGVMEKRRLGISKKPMVVVPNHLVLQWARDFVTLYPSARIIAATPADFKGPARKRLFARIASGDFDAVIVGHSSFGFIKPNAASEAALLDEMKEDLEEALKAANLSGDKRTLSQIRKRLQALEERLESLRNVKADDIGVDFTSMGIDDITVDEAQEFKNLQYTTSASRVIGMNDPLGSKKAFDLYVKVRSLQENGGRVTFATGTPVSNSLVEVYTVMKYLANADLRSRNQLHYDAWAGAYAQTQLRFEYTATQKLAERNVLAGMINLKSLNQIYTDIADTVTKEALISAYEAEVKETNKERAKEGLPLLPERFPIPKVRGGKRRIEVGPRTALQNKAMDYLVARMNGIKKNRSNKFYPKVDNDLWVLTDARKMSLDIRTLDPTLPRDENGKVARSATEIKRIYDKTKDVRGTQLVFCDLSTPSSVAPKAAKDMILTAYTKLLGEKEGKARAKRNANQTYENQWKAVEVLLERMTDEETDPDRVNDYEEWLAGEDDPHVIMTTADVGFSVYDDLRQALVEKGIPQDEIAFIHDYNTLPQKDVLFHKVNSGRIRILLGSSQKMGAGTNVQERLVALHHLDAPWRPSDIEQREGRIIRQGNKLYEADPEGFAVDIIAYSTDGTSDTVLWQVLERKQAGIEQFREGGQARTEEDQESDADQYAEFMAATTNNPVYRYKMEAERALLEKQAETAGLSLAKQRAKLFLEKYAENDARDAAIISEIDGLKLDNISYFGETVAVAELDGPVAAQAAAYDGQIEKYLEKKAEAEKLREEMEKRGVPQDEWPSLPAKPPAPSLANAALAKASPYVKVMREILDTLEGRGEGAVIPFKVGNANLEAMKTGAGPTTRYVIRLKLAKEHTVTLAVSMAKTPSQSPELLRSMTPAFIKGEADQTRERTVGSRKRRTDMKPQMDAAATRDIDLAAQRGLEVLVEWYQAEVALAEVEADRERGREFNPFIAADRKGRDIRQFDEPKPDNTAGKVFLDPATNQEWTGTGVSGNGLTSIRDVNGRRGIYKAGKNGSLSVDMGAVMLKEPQEAVDRRKQDIKSRTSALIHGLNQWGEENTADLKDRLHDYFERIGIAGNVVMAVADNLLHPKDGPLSDGVYYYSRGIIGVSLKATSGAAYTLDHEVIHALRDEVFWGSKYGLFTKEEWQALVAHVRQDAGLMDEIERLYPIGGNMDRAGQYEEAIAEAFARWARDNSRAKGPVAKAFEKIQAFFDAVRRAFGDVGLVKAEQVFKMIDNGTLGARSGPRKTRANRFEASQNIKNDVAKSRASSMNTAANVAGVVNTKPSKWKSAGNFVSDAVTDVMGGGNANALSLIPTRPLFMELGKKIAPARIYLRLKEEMDALRNEWHEKTDKTATKWRDLTRKNQKANESLMDLMHRATISGIDPSEAFVEHEDTAKAEKLAKDDGGDVQAGNWASAFLATQDAKRRAHDALRTEFLALPQPFQAIFSEVRNDYARMGDEFEAAILDNIKSAMKIGLKRAERAYDKKLREAQDGGLTGQALDDALRDARIAVQKAKEANGWAKNARIAKLRHQFETNKLKGPYFPLWRTGKYFVVQRNSQGEVVSFSRFETAGKQRAELDRIKAELPEIVASHGIIGEGIGLKDQVDPRFVADVMALVGEAGGDAKMMDEIWQRWLETMPDQSIRTSRIHRKNTAGFSKDALRAYASHLFHGAHQLARLKYGLEMDDALTEAELEAAKSKDPVRQGLVVEEMRRRHEFTMQPTGSRISAAMTSLAFVWYLGFSPASAAVNISQTTVVGIPILAAAFPNQGVSGASAALGRAASDFLRGKGHASQSERVTANEKRAIAEAQRRGTIDRSQAHDLTAVADTGVEYSPVRAKWMRRIGWLFHKAEVANREATFLAAYRLAMKDGIGHDASVEKAADLTWKIHFDYQNTSRPRIMQNDWMKVLTTFRQFNVNMLWRLFRDTHQSLKGESAEDRREARAQLIGVTLSMMSHAGIKGTWGFGLIMSLLALFSEGDDDDMAAALTDALLLEGEDMGSKAWNYAMGMALEGIPSRLLHISLSERIGMPNLWFRGSNRDLEGQDLFNYLLGELVGPVGGIAASAFTGVERLANGAYWRGAESLMPKAARDLSKTVRYGFEGVETLKGDPILENVSWYQMLAQASGFTPAEVAERYEINSRLMNAQQRIIDRRSGLQRKAGDYVMRGEAIPSDVLAKIEAFNGEYPEYPITPATLRQSVQGRQRASARNEYGIQLNPKLNERLRNDAGKGIYN